MLVLKLPCPEQWFQPRVFLPYDGHFGISGNSFSCSSLEYCWNLIETRDADKHPTRHKLAFIIKIYLVQNVSSSKA